MLVIEFENRETNDLSHASQSSVVALMESEDTEVISSPLIESLKALEAAVQGLHRLGLAIRQSSTTNLTQRITAFIEKIDGGSTEELFLFRLKIKLIDEPRRKGRPGASLTLFRKSKRDWERHVDDDLEPYTCISEDCVEPPHLFSRYESWVKHMEDKHSCRWTELVHKPISWCCDTGHEEQYFETVRDFDEHLRTSHQDYGEEDEIAELKEWCEFRRARPPYTCPICGCVPEDIATVAPWLIQRTSTKQDPQPDQGRSYPESVLRASLLRHIASHLKTLSFMSIIYLDDEEDNSHPHSVVSEEADDKKSLTDDQKELRQTGVSNNEHLPSPMAFPFHASRPSYFEICFDVRSQFTIKFKKAGTKDRFATRGMVRDILSRPMLERLYNSICDDVSFPDTGINAVDAHPFIQSIEAKKLHEFLAILLYAKCSINAARAFTNELVFGNMAKEHQRYSETPYLLPATEAFLANLFDRFDAQEFFAEQRPFCTIVLGGPRAITIDQDDKRSLPWLDEKHIGSGAFGIVYEVKIPKYHLTVDGDFTQFINTSILVARKDYKPNKNMEENFEKEVRSIRDIFIGNSAHKNILESLGTLVIRGPEPKFSIYMPLADMDLQKYMEGNPDLSSDDRWARERIISAAIGLADGLEFLHSKMTTSGGDRLVCYHMDLKPSNILVFLHEPRTEGIGTKYRDYGMIWKLSDFGLSRVTTKTKPEKNLNSLFERRLIDQSSQASSTQNYRGNGTFLPREARDHGKVMDHKIDIWSFGCIISVIFTYMEEGYVALGRYGESRLKYNNKKFDVFYQENRFNRGASLNDAVRSQHTKLIEAAKKRNAAEGEAVSFVLRFLEKGRIPYAGNSKSIHITLNFKASSLTISSALSNSFRKERPAVLVDIYRWRLDIDKSARFKDCRSSPDGQLIAYWNDKTIMVFDRTTAISRKTSSSTLGTGLRATSMDSVRDRVLRNVGKHRLGGISCSWKSLGFTDSYLVAVTTETKSLECYVFDIALDRTLRTYSIISLPYSEFHSFTVSPNQNAMACILNNNGQASLLTAVVEKSLSEPSTLSPSVFSETLSRRDYQDAGICLVQPKLLDLDCSTSSVEHIALSTDDEGYIVVRRASTLSLCLFTIRHPRVVKQDLKLGSPTSSFERLFTDMVSFRSEANDSESEVIVVTQAQRIFHLKFRGADKAASSVAYLPVEYYRILKIATNGQVVVALGTHSGRRHLFLFEVKLSNPTVRPQLRSIAELKEVSTSCQAKLSVIGDWSEPIALITASTIDGQYHVG
ncbi:serine/threonine protein kinase [Fusarium proliferatum]|nr:serine/threonine protein kinase [Fusarium proliferatum]